MSENTGHNLQTTTEANEKARAFHLQAIARHALLAPNWRQCSADQMERYGITVADIRNESQRRATNLMAISFSAGLAWSCAAVVFGHATLGYLLAFLVYGEAINCGLLMLAASRSLAHQRAVQCLAWLLAWPGFVFGVTWMLMTGGHLPETSVAGALLPVIVGVIPETRARLSSLAADSRATKIAGDFSEAVSLPFMGTTRAFENRWRNEFQKFMDNPIVEQVDLTGRWVGSFEFDFKTHPLDMVLKRTAQGRFEGTAKSGSERPDSILYAFVSGDRFVALRRHLLFGIPGSRATKFLGTWDDAKQEFRGEYCVRNGGLGIFVLSRGAANQIEAS